MEKNIKVIVINFLNEIILRVENDECSDTDMYNLVSTVQKEHRGYIHEKDYVNTDEAMKILRITSRNKFFELIKKKGIQNKKVNNHCIGFPRKEIEDLSKTLM